MADPTSPIPWWVTFLEWLETTVKKNWSGLAVLFYEYEADKIDAAKQAQKSAELNQKMAENEITIRKDAATKSVDDIIDDTLSGKPKS